MYIALFTVCAVLSVVKASAQRPLVQLCYIVDGDTLPHYDLPAVVVAAPYALLTAEEIRRNQKLIRNVRKTLPYARMAKSRLDELEKRASGMTPKQRKEVMKQTEKEILDEFSEELKKLTFSQGKVLLKLIDRETGTTSYVLVGELRGKMRASFYQTFARIFGYNLKAHFDPKHNKEDDLIDRIVRAIELGRL